MKKTLMYLICSIVALAAFSSTARALCGDPDPSNVALDNADIYDIDGGDLITVIADPFPDDSLIGHWVAARTSPDLPIRHFRIVSNEHFAQNNISVFSVAEDLEHAGGSNWWLYSGQGAFDIVAPLVEGANTDDPTFTGPIRRASGAKLLHESATVSFLNGGQVGQWIGVTPAAGQPEQFFEIVANTTQLQPNGRYLNTFLVDGNLQAAGVGNWWKLPNQNMFTIYEPCN